MDDASDGISESAYRVLASIGMATSLLSILGSSAILFIALVNKGGPQKGDKHYGYGISIAVVAFALALVGLALTFSPSNDRSTKSSLVSVNLFSTLWSFVGAGFLTSPGKAPFAAVGNGYFAAWGLVVFSCLALGTSVAAAAAASSDNRRPPTTTVGAMMGLLASSIVLWAAILTEGMSVSAKTFGERLYGLILSIITVIIMLLMIRNDMKGRPPWGLKLPLLQILGVNWITAANLLTFRGPFTTVSNGYFSAWAGAFSSLFATVTFWKGMQQQNDGDDDQGSKDE